MSITGFLRRIPLFKNFSEEDLESIKHVFTEKEYKKNQVIFMAEETGKFMYIVKYGEVKVIQGSLDGRENILAIHHVGDTFGEMSMLDGKTSPATVVAKEDCRIISISRSYFESVLMKNSRTNNALLQILCQKLRESWKMIQVLKYNDAETRIRQLLVNLSESEGVVREDGVLINCKITHQELAEMAGISRETVSRILSRLQRKKLLRSENRRLVLVRHPFWRKW